MNIPSLSLKNQNLVWFILSISILGGVWGFINLGKKEDSTFVIKSAAIICFYPGATPLQVEELITEPIEREIQSMRSIYKISSDSRYGASQILVELSPSTPAESVKQLWDELRNRVRDIELTLPEGASQIIVNDDFGDVFGIYYGVTASQGFSFDELRHWAHLIQRRILAVDGVQKVALSGEQTPVINLYITPSQLVSLTLTPEQIMAQISSRSSLVASSSINAGEMIITLQDIGSYNSVDDIENQLLITDDGRQLRVGDIAQVEESYLTPPSQMMHINQSSAIGIGVSTSADSDVVATGRDIELALNDLINQMPIGIDIVSLYPEDKIAAQATNDFLINLLLSVVIVISIIMLAMGRRAGVIIGSSLIFTIGGTLVVMMFIGEGLNRTSLAGFIIAMGMLVDNAIVVTDNAQGAIRQGVNKLDAIINGADAPKWSLLGATLIAIFSFLPLYLAPSAVAEIVKPLFIVLSISLLLSWSFALTQTPLFCSYLLSEKAGVKAVSAGRFDAIFNTILRRLIHHKWVVISASFLLFFIALYIMGSLPQNFFPSLDKPYFRADIFLPNGYDIYATNSRVTEIEEWLMEQEEVKNVSSTLGGTPPRYYIASGSYSLMPNYANMLVELHNSKQSGEVESRFSHYVREKYPDIWLRSSLFMLSPVPDANIEFGFIGDDIDTLLHLTTKAEEIMHSDDRCINIRNSWGNRIPIWQGEYSQMLGQRIGVTRGDIAKGLSIASSGYYMGDYRRGDQVAKILLKDRDINSINLTNLQTLPIFSARGRVYSIEQTVSGFNFEFSNSLIERHNRSRVMKAQCDPYPGVNTKELYKSLYHRILSEIPLPDGYTLKPFGEEETQEESNAALTQNFPLTIILIFIVLLLLFGNYRDPIIILMMLPMIFIGVVIGLATTGKLFDFFALLGVLGLIGMNVKSGVVLLARIRELRDDGVDALTAIIDATRSRVIPVVVAAVTTILGVVPLLFDSLFGAMAATIMGGLLVATILTIFLLPVSYAIFYGVKN
ncbi:MAG: efflux RND transporter permease subunit [Rikenellaceae bacterium]